MDCKGTVNKVLNKERGFALLLTLSILLGVLTIVVPLVILNNQGIKEATQLSQQMQANYAIQSGKNLAKFVGQLKHPEEKTRFLKNYVLPGSQNFPIKMKLRSNVTAIATNIDVENILLAFLSVATNIDTNGDSYTLTTAINSVGAVTPNVSGAGLQTSSNYLVVGNELMLFSGASVPATGRGVAGILEPHAVGESVFGITSDTELAYLKINREWIKINSWDCASNRFSTISSNRNINGLSSTPTHSAGDIVEFYIAYPKLDDGDKYAGFINIEIIDERSKLNINNLSETLGMNLFTGTNVKYSGISTLHPFTSLEGMNQLTEMSHLYESMVRPFVTVYSEPDYTVIGSGNKEVNIPQGILRHMANPSFSAGAGVDDKIFQSPVNFNTASVTVMKMVLWRMGLSFTEAEALGLAIDIEDYRSGYSGNAEYYNGLNPFDGFGDRISKRYASAEEEFSAFLSSNVTTALSPTQKKLIMNHVYAYDTEKYASMSNVMTPICFEVGKVRTAKVTAGVKKNNLPGIVRQESITYKDVGIAGNIILNHQYGWNEHMSTFYGVEYKQMPFLSYAAGNVTYSLGSGNLGGSLEGLIGGTWHDMHFLNNGSSNISSCYTNSANLSVNQVGMPVNYGLRVRATGNMTRMTVSSANLVGPSANIVIFESFTGAAPGNLLFYQSPEVYMYNFNAAASVTGGYRFDLDSADMFGDTGSTPLAANDQIYLVSEPFDSSFYPSGANVPYYETAIFKKGAVWGRLDYIERSNGPTVEVLHKSGSDPYSVIASGASLSGSDNLWLRVNFHDITPRTSVQDGTFLSCPQLFEIKIGYTLSGNVSRLILDQR